jgi:hypothetical protein
MCDVAHHSTTVLDPKNRLSAEALLQHAFINTVPPNASVAAQVCARRVRIRSLVTIATTGAHRGEKRREGAQQRQGTNNS